MYFKKLSNFFLCAALAATSLGLASCSDDDNKGDEPDPGTEVTSAIYVVNNGVQTGNVPGGITVYDLNTGKITDDGFAAANANLSIGDTPQSAIIAGGYMYVAVSESNLIWVLDPTTLQVVKSIVPEAPATTPRELAYDGRNVYVSLYSGHVGVIDGSTNTLTRTITVGPNPEGLAVAGGKLYVANSDGQNWEAGYSNCSMSVIDLTSFTESKINVGLNPTKVLSPDGKKVFVICMGNYGDIPATVKAVEGTTARDICPGTLMASDGNSLYVIDSPIGGSATYGVYDFSGRRLRDMVDKGVESPAGLAVDSVSGDIVVLSYQMGSGGWALYSDPCYAQVYNADGSSRTKFTTGVGSTCAIFAHIYQ